MDIISFFIGFILHLDVHLAALIQSYGPWIYALLFIIIFLETGIILAPYLPGDSLLFAAGAFCAAGSLNLAILLPILALASVLGDSLNYTIGHYIGPIVFKRDYKWLNRRALDRTHAFFEKYGPKTIILARFVPIIRTFAPFIAGIGQMKYGRFIIYNIIGGIAWVSVFALAGFFFGNIPIIKNNFTFAIIGIIVISLIPLIVEVYKYMKESKQAKPKK
jgi:membrane-associated protein